MAKEVKVSNKKFNKDRRCSSKWEPIGAKPVKKYLIFLDQDMALLEKEMSMMMGGQFV